jgi:hypothetical protein
MNMEMSVERMEKKLCENKANTGRTVGYAWWLHVRLQCTVFASQVLTASRAQVILSTFFFRHALYVTQ